MSAELQDNPMIGAEGIMTTDTHPKALSARVGDATITWVAKGSGMIEPNMATMLALHLHRRGVSTRRRSIAFCGQPLRRRSMRFRWTRTRARRTRA
jgi:hypothetical protein